MNSLSVKQGFKYFTGYQDVFLPKLSAYKKDFDEIKNMSFFLINDDELLEKYSEI